jgi:hypothetical protein
MNRATLPILTMTFCLTAAVAGCSGSPKGGTQAGSPNLTSQAPPPTVPSSPVPASSVPDPATSRAAPAPATSVPAAPAASPASPASPGRSAGTKPRYSAPASASARPLDPVSTPTAPECAPEFILPTAKKLVDDPAAGMTVASVEVPVCRDGYARVFTVPAKSPQRFEGDQLFLQLRNGDWKLVGRGASIDCGDAGLPPEVAKACEALS